MFLVEGFSSLSLSLSLSLVSMVKAGVLGFCLLPLHTYCVQIIQGLLGFCGLLTPTANEVFVLAIRSAQRANIICILRERERELKPELRF